jgi:hypothetical protein
MNKIGKRRVNTVFRFSLAAMCLMLGSACAHAEASKQNAAAAQALKKTQGMLRQLSQEKIALETEKSKLLEQMKKLETRVNQLEPLTGEIERYKAGEALLQNTNSALAAQVNSGREKQQALLHKQQEIVAQAKLIQKDNRHLVEAVKEREQWISQCRDKNNSLLEGSRELLAKYKEKGFWDKVGELEPFTGIGNIEAETTEHNYRFKLQDLSVTPFASESTVQAGDENTAKQTPKNSPDTVNTEDGN